MFGIDPWYEYDIHFDDHAFLDAEFYPFDLISQKYLRSFLPFVACPVPHDAIVDVFRYLGIDTIHRYSYEPDAG